MTFPACKKKKKNLCLNSENSATPQNFRQLCFHGRMRFHPFFSSSYIFKSSAAFYLVHHLSGASTRRLQSNRPDLLLLLFLEWQVLKNKTPSSVIHSSCSRSHWITGGQSQGGPTGQRLLETPAAPSSSTTLDWWCLKYLEEEEEEVENESHLLIGVKSNKQILFRDEPDED